MIKIYQIYIENSVRDMVNKLGHGEAAKMFPNYGAYLDLSFTGSKKYKPEMFKYFRETFRVKTNDLEKAFELTNLWNDEKAIEVVSKGHSTSVGDIMELNGKYFMVNSFGFAEIVVEASN